MAELEVVTQETPAEEGAAGAPGAPPGPGRTVKLAIVGGAVVVGLAAGALGVAPRFLHSKPAAAKSEPTAKLEAKSGESDVFEIKNLVTNPAGAEGVHFIMATLAFESGQKGATDYLRNNEALVKDAVVTTLSSLTMDDLSRPDARERIKTMVSGRLDGLVKQPGTFTVYLPEFVVQ